MNQRAIDKSQEKKSQDYYAGDPFSKQALNKFVLYLIVVHAEYNAILSKGAPSFKGCTLYVTKYPCHGCAQVIVQSGISKVVYKKDNNTPTDDQAPIPFNDIDPEYPNKTMKPNSYLASQRILTKCLHKENEETVKSVILNSIKFIIG